VGVELSVVEVEYENWGIAIEAIKQDNEVEWS